MNKIRIYLFFLIGVLVFSIIGVSAEEATFTQTQAEELFFEGYKLFHVYQDQICWNTGILPNGPRYLACFEVDANKDIEVSINGETYDNFDLLFGYNDGKTVYPISSNEDLIKLAGNFFEESLVEEIMTDAVSGEDDILFYEDEYGNMYYHQRGIQTFPLFSVVGYTDFKVDGNKASIVVDFEHANFLPATFFIKKTVEFVKTDAGWRIANNIFADELYNGLQWKGDVYKVHYYWDDENYTRLDTIVAEYHINTPGEYPEDLPDFAKSYLLDRGDTDTPNTGDSTAALFATIALAAVITPFALSRKRRAR